MASNLSTTRTAIQTALTGATGGGASTLLASGRVYLGFKSRAAGTLSLFDDVVANGPAAFVGPVTRLKVDSLIIGPAMIHVLVCLYKSKAADQDMKDVDDLVANIAEKLTATAVYGSGLMPPRSISLDDWEWQVDSTDGLLLLRFTLEMLDPHGGGEA